MHAAVKRIDMKSDGGESAAPMEFRELLGIVRAASDKSAGHSRFCLQSSQPGILGNENANCLASEKVPVVSFDHCYDVVSYLSKVDRDRGSEKELSSEMREASRTGKGMAVP
jgi:hypothetical protein